MAAPVERQRSRPWQEGLNAEKAKLDRARKKEEFFAEDITPPDEAFATWTDAELAQFFEQGGVVHR